MAAPEGFRVRRRMERGVTRAATSAMASARVVRAASALVGSSAEASAELSAVHDQPPPSPLADRLRAAAAEILAVADELDAQRSG